MRRFLKWTCIWMIMIMMGTSLFPHAGDYSAKADEMQINEDLSEEFQNLALNKPSSASSSWSSSYESSKSFDGDEGSRWSAGRGTLGGEWIQTDLGAETSFNWVVIKEISFPRVEQFELLVSDDGELWEALDSGTTIGELKVLHFDKVQARYLRLLVHETTDTVTINEIEVYDAMMLSILDRVYLTDAQHEQIPENETFSIKPGESIDLDINGVWIDGQHADLSNADVNWVSSNPEVAAVDADGNITGIGDGVAKITASVSLNDVTMAASVFVTIRNPHDWFADTALLHDQMAIKIGEPAIMQPGDNYPSVKIKPYMNGSVTGILTRDGLPINELTEKPLRAEQEQVLSIAGTAEQAGHYKLELQFQFEGHSSIYDSFHFTVLNPEEMDEDESRIAYIGADGKLNYVPDYKGNRILDFSNSGYMGGGRKIPDVQARVVVKPGEGDDSARIQQAIDQVSAMPMLGNGFRGAVVLEKGTYEVGKTLEIRASGVVLRGQGQDEDGTILLATGTNERTILNIKGRSAGPQIIQESKTEITDLYVPSGARTFHVQAPDAFRVGERVMIRRYGNDHWIHEIDMDQIVNRPGSTPGSTQQWSAFHLDFDRIITDIEGNIITVDAPLANSIEKRWGGGEMMKYDDPGRIEHVGVENLRVVSEFDPAVTETNNGEEYYADEHHARTFIELDNVKNAWVREVTGLHLSYALIHAGRSAKWITVQDCTVMDMVSILTGGRRYPFLYEGQLLFTQRAYVESARHAFIVGSRVSGPNVFLNSVSIDNHGDSEPHHRWSVGGLFDQVHAPIAIQDRGWYGSGHGWSGANYVAWNTEGKLIVQSPPTAQNYAIGHVGKREDGAWPRTHDMRPREQGYWESHGQHVQPQSLYLQQLEDRLGKEAVEYLERSPVGGAELDTPVNPANLPQLSSLQVNGEDVRSFSPDQYVYNVKLPLGENETPHVSATSEQIVDVIQASSIYGDAVITVTDREDPALSVRYTVRFQVLPVFEPVPEDLVIYPIASVTSSDHHPNYPPMNTIDWDISTRWAANGEQWAQFDLGQVKAVSDAAIAMLNGHRDIYHFDLQTSLDGEHWTNVFSGSSSGKTDLLELYTFPETLARYIRFAGHGNSKDGWNNLNEVVIAGRESEFSEIQANGFVEIDRDEALLGHKAKKLHIELKGSVSKSGQNADYARIHAEPQGLNLEVEAIKQLAIANKRAFLQGTAKDNGDQLYTVWMILAEDTKSVSLTVWRGEHTKNEPVIQYIELDFQGNIHMKK